jgi:hypothetical protein
MHNLQQRDFGLPRNKSQMKVAPEPEVTKTWHRFAKEVAWISDA